VAPPPPPTPPSAPAPGRAGRNLPAAIAVGVGLGGLVVASLFVVKWLFIGLATVAVLIAVVELGRAMSVRGARVPVVPIALGGVAMLVSSYLSGSEALVITLLLTVAACAVWQLAERDGNYLQDVSAGAFVALYVPFLASFTALMLSADDGPRRVVALIATVVCNDVGGYAVGVLAGRHPMAPSVSPKKSWEGFGGSLAACALAGGLLLTLLLQGTWWQGVLFGVAIAIAATLGDFGESMIKRDLGIKDMSNLLPGHGGIMDRLDSMLVAAPVAWLLLGAFL
jgi:phosphatidate cytidylyltransferase